jgi:DMSO reductase anchor subunit
VRGAGINVLSIIFPPSNLADASVLAFISSTIALDSTTAAFDSVDNVSSSFLVVSAVASRVFVCANKALAALRAFFLAICSLVAIIVLTYYEGIAQHLRPR